MGSLFGRFFLGLGALAVGCAPIAIAPPARVTAGAMPELPSPSAGAMALGVDGFFVAGDRKPTVGPAAADLSFRQGVAADMAVEVSALGRPALSAIMVAAGVQWFPVHHRWLRGGAELGGAAGCGGIDTRNNSKPSGCGELFAWGGYTGLSAGARLHPNAAIFATVRYEITRAGTIPWTHWVMATSAFQVNSSHLFVTAAAGLLYLSNTTVRWWLPFFVQLSAGLMWGRWGEP